MIARKKILKLNEFTPTNWIEWILKLYKNENVVPEFEFGDISLDYKLLLIKNSLEEAGYDTGNLARASISILNEYCVKPNSEELIYSILQFIVVLKPEQHATFLEILFTSNVLKDKYYLDVNLHKLLLVCLLYFKNIDDLEGYFSKSLINKDLETCIIGLKYFLLNKPLDIYFKYLDDVIILNNDTQTLIYINDIILSISEMIFLKQNYKQLYEWWINSDYIVNKLNPTFSRQLIDEFLRWLNNNNPLIHQNDISKFRLLLKSMTFKETQLYEYFKMIIPIIPFSSIDFTKRIISPLTHFLIHTGTNPYYSMLRSNSNQVIKSRISFFKRNALTINEVISSSYRNAPSFKLSILERRESLKELTHKYVDNEK